MNQVCLLKCPTNSKINMVIYSNFEYKNTADFKAIDEENRK